ncbi:MAG: hypothetical protein R3F07_19740 [Opitutaceae bacterium]
MKSTLLAILIVLSLNPAYSCMEVTFINDENYESTEHPFTIKADEGYLMVSLAHEMANGCGKYQRSGVGNNDGPIDGFEPDDSENTHDYFFFDHQLKDKELEVAGWYDCDGCSGNTKVYVLELDKIEKMKSANQAAHTTPAIAPR